MAKIPEPIIDFHVHLFPDRLFDAIWDAFVRHYDWNIIHRHYYKECIERLRQGGAASLFIPTMLTVPASQRDSTGGTKASFRNMTISTASPRITRTILMHWTWPVGNQYVGLESFMRALQKFPDLPATVAHLGAHECEGFIGLLDGHPNLYLDTAFCFLPPPYQGYTLGPGYLEKYKSRILYGSDYPNLITPRESEIESLLEMGLSQDFYDKVFHDNGIALIRSLTGKPGGEVPDAQV